MMPDTGCTLSEHATVVRKATIADVPALHGLINDQAERGKLLFRDHASLYEHLRDFFVWEQDGSIVGCCALEVVWRDLAELKSLAVADRHRGRGIGRRLVAAALDEARRLGIARVFALTREQGFFQKLGFAVVAKDTLPHKVWSDCVRCPIKDCCDEIAMAIDLGTTAGCSTG